MKVQSLQSLQAEPKLIQIMSECSLCLCRMSSESWDFTNISHFALSAVVALALCLPLEASDLRKGIVDTMLEGAWCPNWQ